MEELEKLEVEIRFAGEMDEFWSFVGNKENQRWTWYAIERVLLINMFIIPFR